MWDFSIARSLWLMGRTMPYLLLRVALYFAITFAYMAAIGAGSGAGYMVGLSGDEDFRAQATLVGGFIGFGVVGGIVFFLREYMLYMVKAGQIAVMTELLAGNELPQGQGQLGYGASMVKERFPEVNGLFALDQLIKAVVHAVTGLLTIFTMILPGLSGFMNFLSAVIRISVTYVDEVILAHNFRVRSKNPWTTSRSALVLYAQNGWTMVRNAIWLAVISWAVTLAVFFLMIAPAGALFYYLQDAWGGFGFLAAIVFAWAFRAAIVEPFGIACLMQVYFKVTEGQTPDPGIDAKLMQASAKFRALTERARGAMGMAT